MSVKYKSHDFVLIDHRDYVLNIFKKTKDTDNGIKDFTLLSELFCILSNNHRAIRKRSFNSDELLKEASNIKEKHGLFKKLIPENLLKSTQRVCQIQKTIEVRALAQQLFEKTTFNFIGIIGGNNSEEALKCKVRNDYFLIPPHSRFFSGDIKEQCLKLSDSKFDILVADPPWWNKYIRRLKDANDKLSYSMMYNEDIAGLPVQDLLAANCLVAVWCTNSPSNIAAVKDLIFPKWGVEFLTTWYWLKVTTDLEPICAFGMGCQKQPYERLILGRVGQIGDVPCERLIVSVPSALHSHKPPLFGKCLFLCILVSLFIRNDLSG